jgi:hypothetical protein
MREIFTSGSVGRAPGNRCLYPEISVLHGYRYLDFGNMAKKLTYPLYIFNL